MEGVDILASVFVIAPSTIDQIRSDCRNTWSRGYRGVNIVTTIIE